MLETEHIAKFIEDGFVHVPGSFSRALAERCVEIMWPGTGCAPHDRTTWTKPLVRLPEYSDEPFRTAIRMPGLEKAFDQLVGPGRWRRRSGIGPIPARFPHTESPGDDYWHFEGSYFPEGWKGHSFTNYRSRGCALLMLFLFTDVAESDAPTRLRVGSHRAVPGRLRRYGDEGIDATRIDETGVLEATADLPVAYATGSAGDAYLCHPFLIHAAQPHHGDTPRFMATPTLEPTAPLELDRADGTYSPVEAAIRVGLGMQESENRCRGALPGGRR
ncbi:phytanoyl-CoA dioxygenase family protein [Nocardia sp. CS682]|uniref:phytanoyl-CoA dioxygenase family protein n=1 Tax=Nocardia sp. CS682 TaxID=1047172 RepID=UPI001074DE95|nr:phytanoyl-CoA dioxygenase family protein [Nocardia sp. CS682]QBS39357.1 phytanoyl-CoA dioxygenase [Nocardia sp. CS682]